MRKEMVTRGIDGTKATIKVINTATDEITTKDVVLSKDLTGDAKKLNKAVVKTLEEGEVLIRIESAEVVHKLVGMDMAKFLELAEELDIPCQARTNNAGSNDAGMIHRTRRGARAAAVSVPCRYIHSPVSMASVSDAENAVKLIRALAKAMVESK